MFGERKGKLMMQATAGRYGLLTFFLQVDLLLNKLLFYKTVLRVLVKWYVDSFFFSNTANS